jgi:hypothetical protein
MRAGEMPKRRDRLDIQESGDYLGQVLPEIV